MKLKNIYLALVFVIFSVSSYSQHMGKKAYYPVFRIIRTSSVQPQGTIVLFPDEGDGLSEEDECTRIAEFLNGCGFNVAVYTYQTVLRTNSLDTVIYESFGAFRLLRTKPEIYEIHGDHFGMMGLGSGGYIAAGIVQQLSEKEQPAELILLNPSCLDNRKPGTVFPAVMPPLQPTSRLFVAFSGHSDPTGVKSGKEYTKTWTGYDGQAAFHVLLDTENQPDPGKSSGDQQTLQVLLKGFFNEKPDLSDPGPNSAAIPVEGYSPERHTEKVALVKKNKFDLILIGNSITHFWGGEPRLRNMDGTLREPNGPRSWASVFSGYRVLNLGFGWDRTQNVLWRLDHGELDGLHPRVVIIHIGTNNTSETANARMNTAPEIVEGIQAICVRVRSKVPGAKIVLMAVFPREQSPLHPRRLLINQINQHLEAFAHEQNISFVDIGQRMLAPDGTLPKDMAGDFCHPTEKGYQIWADEIRSLVSEP